jgi:hypothetical protein
LNLLLWLDEERCKRDFAFYKPSQTVLEPRKSPVRERSAATVDAIPEATMQVLLQAAAGT